MASRKKKKIRVSYRKLGRERAWGLAYHKAFGDDYKDHNLIELDPRLVGYSHLLTLIHEALHLRHPSWSETKVLKESSKLAKIVWGEGYRKHEYNDGH